MNLGTTPLASRTDPRWTRYAGVVLVAALVFVWPIPRTISLRDLLLLALLCWGGYEAYRHRAEPLPWRALRIPLGLFLGLTVWILIVALLVSTEPAWTLGEIKGQWLKACIALAAGGLVGIAIRNDDSALRLTLTIICVALFAHVFYVAYEALSVWSEPKITHARLVGRFSGGSDKRSYLTNMLLYFLMAEILIRSILKRRCLPVGNISLMVITMVALFAVYVIALRNGIVELVIVLTVAVILVMRKSDRMHRPIVVGITLALVIVALILGYLTVRKDERWQTFLETVPIALDIENKAWINHAFPQPKLANGQVVDWSNYSRVARIRAGLSLMAERPLGVGFGRNAFGHAVEQKYGLRTSHSHSGIIDLGVGTGVPGVVLWLAFLGALLRLGYRGVRESHGFPALVLLFLTTGYGFRMLVDSTIRDHMLQMFLFLAAFLAVVAAGRLTRQSGLTAAPPG